MLASLVAALVSAFCYGVAAVMQAMAIRSASHRSARIQAGDENADRVDPRLLVRLMGQWRFLASLGIDLVGFLAQLVALRQLPLFAVQAVIASNLAVTAVFAAWLMHIRLGLKEWLAVAGVVVGVGLLGSSAGGEGAANVGPAFQIALIVTVAGVAVAGIAAARLPNPYRTPVLGATAGLGYAVLAVAARILPGFSPQQLVRNPATYTLAAAGHRLVPAVRVGPGGRQRDRGHRRRGTGRDRAARHRGRAVPRRHHPARPDRRSPCSGFVLAVVCAVALARFGEASEQDGPGSSDDTDPRSRRHSQATTSV